MQNLERIFSTEQKYLERHWNKLAVHSFHFKCSRSLQIFSRSKYVFSDYRKILLPIIMYKIFCEIEKVSSSSFRMNELKEQRPVPRAEYDLE